MPATDARRQTSEVVDVPIDVVSAAEAVARISSWAAARQSRYVCLCNVHSVMTAHGDPAHRSTLRGADMALPDGAPVAWMMRRSGLPAQRRICGPDLMLDYCAHAADTGQSIFLLGSTEQTLDRLRARLLARWPNMRIAGCHSPPFRALGPDEDAALVARINASGAQTIWVSLGCPKQERWMAEHRGQVKGVMLGVGAAFDFHAGAVSRAPGWMQRAGLEWLHRLGSEPRRLLLRYVVTNSQFLAAAGKQLLRHRFMGG